MYHIGNIISKEDIPALGHDYLLRNPVIQEELLSGINENVKEKDKLQEN